MGMQIEYCANALGTIDLIRKILVFANIVGSHTYILNVLQVTLDKNVKENVSGNLNNTYAYFCLTSKQIRNETYCTFSNSTRCWVVSQ